jgi:hypothetical protein
VSLSFLTRPWKVTSHSLSGIAFTSMHCTVTTLSARMYLAICRDERDEYQVEKRLVKR